MTVLVAYATHSGATRTLAETLAATLIADGLAVELADIDDSPDPTGHDAVVLGSGVRVEAVEKSAAAWAQQHSQVLGQKAFAFFSCSGSASDPAKGGRQKATDTFLASLASPASPASFPVTPVAVKNFPGWVLIDRIPMHERLLLKSMRTPTGDFRDLPAVEAWGHEIAPLLAGVRSPERLQNGRRASRTRGDRLPPPSVPR